MDRISISFRTRGLTPEESSSAWNLQSALSSLRGYCDQFASALALFDHALAKQIGPEVPEPLEERIAFRSKYGHWQLIAARDCAINLYNFRHQMDTATSWLHQCPTLNALVSKDDCRGPKARFDRSFPGWIALRDAVAHQGESRGPKKGNKHQYTGPVRGVDAQVEGLFMANALNGRTLMFTAERAIQTLEISQATCGELGAILDTFEAAFLPASKFPAPGASGP